MGASWRRDCISRREPQDGHTGQKTVRRLMFFCTKNIKSLMSKRRTFYIELVYVAFTCTDLSCGSHVNANTRLHPYKRVGPTPIYVMQISGGYQ